MKAKIIKTKSSATVLIAIVAAILLIINLISLNIFSRADLTDNNIYSLSPVSKELAGSLNDRLNVKAFITDDLPAPHNNHARYLKDILDDYRAYSHGYLHYEFIDPLKTDKEQEAEGYRIPPLQFNVFRNDKTEFIKGYKGVAILYGDKQEIIPFIENTDNLEYDLSQAIKKLTSTKTSTVAFTTGHGEPEMSRGLQWASQLLQREYGVQFLDLNNLHTIPPQIDVLFVVSPRSPFSEWEKYLIDQFLMRGGRAAFLLDKFNIDIAKAQVTPIDNGLDSLLNFYGVGLRDKLVIDVQCNMVPVMRSMGQYQMQSVVKYPFYIAISNFNQENPAVKEFKSLNMIFASPVDLSFPIVSGRNRAPLFTTSEQSGALGAPIDISPERQYQQTDFLIPQQPLAAFLSGSFVSYYKDRSVPAYFGTDTVAATPTPAGIDSTGDARVIVIGNGLFAQDDNKRNEAAFALLLNIADWLTQDRGLISIRSKQVGAPVLKETSDAAKKMVKYVNMFVMPLIVIVFGLIRWQLKRSVRRRMAS
ncbi:MAG: Gldg family protein [candidate division Zixibacteria bacterium]|nr:Gldg family protein [candidate division Zixibacteria bacterium]